MSTKKIVFEFPASAWDGIVMSLTQYSYQELVPNPQASSDPTKPSMIPNPKDRDEAAIEEVMNIISSRFENWAIQERMKVFDAANRSEVQAITQQVKENTVAKVE